MHTDRHFITGGALILGAIALLIAGPIPQSQEFHAFADTRAWLSIPNAMDVLSNLPFLLVGLYGLARTARVPEHLHSVWRVLCIALCATCFGSAFYHWNPNHFGLLVDRIPIALACASIALLMLADRVRTAAAKPLPLAVMCVLAVSSCLFWYFSEVAGHGDLRPYIFMQAVPMLLVPLLTCLYRGGAIAGKTWWTVLGLYALAKLCEGLDHQILQTLQFISGHTLKHALAAAAAWVLLRNAFRVD